MLPKAIEQRRAPGDHVYGHVPRRVRSTDQRRRLMIADENQDEIAIGTQAKEAAKRRVGINEALHVARAEIQPVGLLRPCQVEIGFVVRIRREDARPILLVWRRRREGRVGSDCRKEGEHRPARLRLDLQRVHARERKLIGDIPPSERRPVVVESREIVDLFEPIESALRPASKQSRHNRDRAVPMTPERFHESIALLGHQSNVGALIAHFCTRQKTDMRKPRFAAEGR